MSDDKQIKTGKVIKTLPNLEYKVKLASGDIIHTHTSGKMKQNRITCLVGDKVKIKISKYDKNRGILFYRIT